MTTRTKLLLLATAAALSCGLVRWRTMEVPATIAAGTAAAAEASARERETPRTVAAARAVDLAAAAEANALASAPTRREAAELVTALYRKEQLTRELDLEQRRHGGGYWQSMGEGRVLAELERARAAMLKELNAEANAALTALFPADAGGEPIALVAIFDAEHPGPNIGFLSPALRERFEAAIVAGEGERGTERERLLDMAEHVLPPGEMESYRRWNERAAAALRDQLLGFNQTESEFVAILRDTRLADDEREAPGVAAGLATQLGPARFAELQKLQDPAMHTALRDLQRLGLPLGEAEWLASTRARATADIGEIWQNPALTDAAKRERVAQVEHAYGEAIAAKLALPEGALDGIGPGS